MLRPFWWRMSAEFRSRMGSISRQSFVCFAGTIFTAAAGYFFKIYLARVRWVRKLWAYMRWA